MDNTMLLDLDLDHPLHHLPLRPPKPLSPSASVSDDDDPTAKKTPWHRMKWSDDMVRLLITVVSSVGDDSGDDSGGTKRKASGSALQKKGKWKTVSKIMIEKGCYVSPQQCEDKFNDLNKRYKRLNEILGRGTTCQVVENPALLDSMTNVTHKSKEDVRKILSSKHLFYREMCAYHNGQKIPNSQDVELGGCGSKAAEHVVDEEEEEEEEEDLGGCEGLQLEMDGVLRDMTKSVWEQKEWFKKRAFQLQEERLEIQAEAFELEKRRFKWQRFCGKKDRELDRMRLENERMGLENERMAMQVRQKELELEAKKPGDAVGGFLGFRVEGEH